MKITRQELYDLVWSEPMTVLGKRFGLSDNGLRKQCKTMNIPTPSSGYWAKLKFGKQAEKIPLSKDYNGKKQSTDLNEVDLTKKEMIILISPENRYAERESIICSGDISVFSVPEVLYAKDPLIIDTKEKFRQESDNLYLKKSPFKNKIGPTLDIYVSEKTIDRALSIFSTIINALRFRGHTVMIVDNKTLTAINDEKIQINLTERKKQNPNSDNPRSSHNNIFCGELHFNIFNDYRVIDTYKDTSNIKLEQKIITIIAGLEIRSEQIKEDRIEAEQRRIIHEKEELERKEFEEKRKAELNEFKSLFIMAERLHKTNILRQYISTYEEFITKSGEINEEVALKIHWAKEKADWLDPFISKEDKFLDCYKKDEIIQPECPKKNTWENISYTSSYGHSFWSNQYRKWR